MSEDCFCFEVRQLLESGSRSIPSDWLGAFRGYPLRETEARHLMEWYDGLFGHKAEATADLEVEPPEIDPLSGLPILKINSAGEGRFVMYFRPLEVPAEPRGLYYFGGYTVNPRDGFCIRPLENLGEYISMAYAQGKPATKEEAARELDRLLEAYENDTWAGTSRYYIDAKPDGFTPVAHPELSNGEASAFFISEEMTIVIGYAPSLTDPTEGRG